MLDNENSIRKSFLFHPFSRRFHIVLLLMFGFFCATYMRSNIGMAMTCIVNTTAVTIETAKVYGHNESEDHNASIPLECQHEGVDKQAGITVNDYGGTIIWNNFVQTSLVMSTFFGSLVTILPAGYFADRTSAKNLLLGSIINYSLCTLLFPTLAFYTNPWMVMASRVMMGFGEGFIIPAANIIITRWVPNQEKSTAASIFTLGNQFAGGFGIPIITAFCKSSMKWPGVFYFCGFIGFLWCILWTLTVANSPEKAKVMMKHERIYLQSHINTNYKGQTKTKKKIPWIKIFTSLPIIACFISIFGVNMVVVLLQFYQPQFMKEVLYLRLSDNGFYSAAPFLVQFVGKLTWSISIDYMKSRKWLSNTVACKISQTFSTFTMSIFLILITHFADCTRPQIVFIMYCIIGLGFSTAISGFYTSLLLLAPAYIGLISSIMQFIGFCAMLIPPLLVQIFRVYGTLAEWQVIYYIVALYTLFSGIFFLIFGTGEVLPWGFGEHSDETEEEINEEEQSLQKIDINLEQ